MQVKYSTPSIVILTLILGVYSFPAPVRVVGHGPAKSNDHLNTESGTDPVIAFMKRFGYLRDNINLELHSSSLTSSPQSLHNYRDDVYKKAIMDMQNFGALEQTGYLNNDTLALLTKPRCGLPDIVGSGSGHKRRKRYTVTAPGWKKREITYRLENWPPQLDEATVLSELKRAFAVWSDYSRLSFINKPRKVHGNVEISVSFGRRQHGDRSPFDGPGHYLAHAFAPSEYDPYGGDIHFDLDENWTSSLKKTIMDDDQKGNVSLYAVAVHEIGHSLGLGHSPSIDSVMFAYFKNNEEDYLHLGNDDIMGMYKLYIQRSDQEKAESTIAPPVDTTTRRRKPSIETSTRPSAKDENHMKPNLCRDSYDSIAFMRNELFVFKGLFMWRIRDGKVSDQFYPATTSRLFPMLENVERIDAALENESGDLVFFSGRNYWTYDGEKHRGPLHITDFGLPTYLEKIDAAFIWGKNKKLYFFSGNMFWRYDFKTKALDDGYPESIRRWKGVPSDGIDSVITWSDGGTYFFKKNYFWKFDDIKVHTAKGYPMENAAHWFGCKRVQP